MEMTYGKVTGADVRESRLLTISAFDAQITLLTRYQQDMTIQLQELERARAQQQELLAQMDAREGV